MTGRINRTTHLSTITDVRMDATRTVWKFQLRLNNQCIISMPKGARLLQVAMQHHSLCVWALVDPVSPLVRRGFRIAGTGHLIDGNDCANHVSTVFDGPFVWHVFDIGEEPSN